MTIRRFFYGVTKALSVLSAALAILIAALFAIPFVGVFIAGSVGTSLGCTLAADDINPCLLFGIDIRSRLLIMTSSFAALLFTPLFFIAAFGRDMLVLVAVAVAARLASSKLRVRG